MWGCSDYLVRFELVQKRVLKLKYWRIVKLYIFEMWLWLQYYCKNYEFDRIMYELFAYKTYKISMQYIGKSI